VRVTLLQLTTRRGILGMLVATPARGDRLGRVTTRRRCGNHRSVAEIDAIRSAIL
jgi:hypothetical protein